ncbi:hypothetical protein AAHA92_06716 [Salvia divinorum]|uniref:Uncharacterized protein n=1 Tax=Salvia divinorum TaxID=28513 RepID=A0ABD1I6J7_SALDI
MFRYSLKTTIPRSLRSPFGALLPCPDGCSAVAAWFAVGQSQPLRVLCRPAAVPHQLPVVVVTKSCRRGHHSCLPWFSRRRVESRFRGRPVAAGSGVVVRPLFVVSAPPSIRQPRSNPKFEQVGSKLEESLPLFSPLFFVF